MYSSLISPQIVQEQLENPVWRFIDCRYVLTAPDQKKEEFEVSHLPGAIYAHTNLDLAVPHVPGKTGRHPLPSVEEVVKKFSSWGIDQSVQVAVYDDTGGAHAARLWWMLRWLGHDAVAVMDGGWPRWIKEGHPVTAELFVPEAKAFIASETFDPISGHIPGAFSTPFTENLNKDGNWKSKEELRKKYEKLLEGSPAQKAVSYCGSGITACHNILAMYHAGMGDSRLYAGSWSDWITDPDRPVE